VSSPSRTIRLTTEEQRILKSAGNLLNQPISQIVQAGIVEEAHRLGFFAGLLEQPKPYRGTWPYIPERHDESAKERLTLTFDPHTADLLTAAAQHVDVGESLFMVGATFRYLAAIKKSKPDNKTLQRLELPEKFEALLRH
jgi:uncharacterized protein (DUF1778 family)